MTRQVQQNFLSIAPNGAVGAAFPGGVDLDSLPVGHDVDQAPTSTIDWLNTAKALIARIYATHSPATGVPHSDDLFLRAGKDAGAGNSTAGSINLQTTSTLLGGANQLMLLGSRAGGSRLDVTIGGSNRSILREDGSSAFLQFARGKSGTRGGVGGTTVCDPWVGEVFVTPVFTSVLLICAQVSGYIVGGPRLETIQAWVDGIVVANSGFLFNTVSEHNNMGFLVGGLTNVNAGAHTLAVTNPSAGLSVDGNDDAAYIAIG